MVFRQTFFRTAKKNSMYVSGWPIGPGLSRMAAGWQSRARLREFAACEVGLPRSVMGATAIKKAKTTSSRPNRRKTTPLRRGKAEFVEALARGLAVLGAFDEAHAEMALTQVAGRIGVSPATARRSLHTLEALGYLRFVNKRYVLAAHVLTLGAAYIRAAGVDEALMPELRRLVDLFGDASSVSVLDGSNILYIAHCSEQRAARRTAGIGVTYPAYATSMGRVFI